MRRLAILSLPFARLARVQLGPPVLDALTADHDVLVVGPFVADKRFLAEFQRDRLHVLPWKERTMPQPFRAMFALSELFRMRGYWRRFGANRTAWHMANHHVEFGPNGNDTRLPLKRRLLFTAASVIGLWPGAWRLLDRIVGPKVFEFPALREFAGRYDRVTLIQSSSWGVQDRMLAWMAKQMKWRTVLLPYTTDQLFCNGYLMTDFDAVCVQGPVERQFAVELHDLPDTKLVDLGSAWFRHMDAIARGLARGASNGRRRIMFAGVNPIYFPRASERALLDRLMSAVDAGELGDVDVVFRPLPTDDDEQRAMDAEWRHRPRLTIQWPQATCLAVDEFGERRMDVDLAEYLSQLAAADLVVTAGVTSLTIDAANLGVPAISAVWDSTGVMKRRRHDLLFEPDGGFKDIKSLQIVHDIDQLVPAVRRALTDRDGARARARALAEEWDYPSVDFRSTFLKAVTG